MKIDWWTLALQAINFLVLVWLLWRFLYRPAKAVIEKRKQLAERAFADADKEKSAAEASGRRLEEDRAKLAQDREDLLKTLHEELEADRARVLAEAKSKAEDMIADARAAIEEERRAVLEDVRTEVADLAAALAADILRTSGATLSGDALLSRLEAQIEDMPDAERDRLRKDLEPEDARLEIVTASPLGPEERSRWTGRLHALLDDTAKAGFSVDPEILGGVELRFPHAALKLSWADQLRKARKILQDDDPAS